jgi:hypothetical protein
VVGDSTPTDLDGDGRYEDINGDNELNVVDSQALLAHLENESIQNYTTQFDFTGDDQVDISDVQRLYVTAVDPVSEDPDGDSLTNDVEVSLGTNSFRSDTDGDGIPDPVETNDGSSVDTDGDGIIDARDTDSDGDGVADGSEGENDTDGDGVLDYRDTDDDGDTILTRTEVQNGSEFSYDVDFDGVVNWRDTDADDDGVPDRREGLDDGDGDGMPDYLDNDRDNDGLPDGHERDVTNTDPTDNDSATPRANYDAADNGVIDGMEDFEGDTLGAYREYTIGTDPFANDTDGDGLSDGFEDRRTAFDPLTADTDGDGTLDGATDPDNDGLDTAAEDARGTRYADNDTDGDTLSDGREVGGVTDPTKRDTDDDGLSDPDELALETDPTRPDTDRDGVLDGDETFETSATEDETGVDLTLRGEGNLADDVRLTAKPKYFGGVNASAGPTVRIVNERAFTNATVRLPIEESVPKSEYDDLAVYRWSGAANETWTPVETTVKNGTARATVESFSYFTVLDTDEWVNATSFGQEPLSLNVSNRTTCSNACAVRNESTLVLGGEPTARKITVEQDGRSFQVVPLSNGQNIRRFYDYGDAEINSPLPIAKSDKSRLFFWSGPNGLSLVTVHDKPRDGSGAAVSFDFEGLPTGDGRWIVEDDGGDFNDGPASPDWTWTRDNTDGGAFRGGLTNSTITITPKFNEKAERDPLTPGELDGWQVLTGRATDPSNESLALDEPATISVPDDPSEDESLNATGDVGSATVDYDLRSGVSDVSVVYQTEQTDVNPTASVTITGPNGTSVSEQLSIGTVGTVREVLNVSDLSRGEAEISVSADGVNLRAQLVARESFDTDGDGIPDSVEKRTWVLPTGPATTFSTDYENSDTDGDGIPDGKEVEYTREIAERDSETSLGPGGSGPGTVEPDRGAGTSSLQTSLAVVRSDPTEVDSDGDGLTDPEENLGWNTYLATSPEQAEQFVQTRKNGGDVRSVLFEQNVSSDPLQTDADGDGLSDAEERLAGTNPGVADSDSDSIPDAEERRDEVADPAIHDHSAPVVKPLEVSADNAARTRYTIDVAITDNSGFKAVRFYKKGQEQYGILEDPPKNDDTYYNVDIDVDRGNVDEIKTGVGGFINPASVDVRTVDVHDNSKRQSISGPDTFGQAAERYSRLPVNPGKDGLIGLMAFSSGVTTVANEAIAGIAMILNDPVGYAGQMKRFGERVADNPAIIEKLPKLMADQIREQHRTRNPFDDGSEEYRTYAGSWSLGYSTGVVAPAAASGGGSVAQKGVSSSRKLQRLVDAADSAVPRRVPNGVRPGVLLRAGRIDDTLPDTDVRTGTLSARLNDLSGPRRQRVVDQFESLDRGTKDYLGDTDIDAPAVKTADLFRNTGPGGRRTLDALAETDGEAADVLLKIDDPETQWRFVRAYDSGEADADELATALRRYDNLDSDGKQEFDDLMARSGDDAAKLAAQTDSDTFDDIMSLGCGPGRSSLGGVGSLTDEAYYSVSPPSRPSVALASGGCLSGDAKDDFRAGLAKATNDPDIDVEDDFSDVVDAVETLDGDSQQAAVDMINDLGADGVRVTNGATDLGSRKHSILTDSEVDDLLTSYDSYRNSDIATRDVNDIQTDIDQIAKSDVGGLNSAIRNGINSNTQLKGLDQEVEITTDLMDNDNVVVKDMSVDGDDGMSADIPGEGNRESEVDVDIESTDGSTIGVESKNLDYNSVPPVDEYRNDLIDDLRNKFNVVSRNRDEMVIVTPTENPRSNDVISKAIEDADFADGFDPDSDLRFVSPDETSTIG